MREQLVVSVISPIASSHSTSWWPFDYIYRFPGALTYSSHSEHVYLTSAWQIVVSCPAVEVAPLVIDEGLLFALLIVVKAGNSA